MQSDNFPEWDKFKDIEVTKFNGIKTVLVKGQTRMKWKVEDEASQRMAIVQLYNTIAGNQKFLANLFQIHINSVRKYISDFANHGFVGLLSQTSGPRDKWKMTPQLRAKILLIVLKMGVTEYEGISEKLKDWNEDVSLGSIHQVLSENGLAGKRINISAEEIGQIKLFENQEEQYYFKFSFNKATEWKNLAAKKDQEMQQVEEDRE